MRRFHAILLVVLFSGRVDSQVSDPANVQVGDQVCFEGFVMDHFCINRGTLLDAPDIVSLLNPELHSLHCLIDVPRCRDTPYELLAPPAEGETMYTRAFRLTENSKQGFLMTASAVGNPTPPDKAPCTDCVGTEGSLNSGFRAEVYGIVVAPAMDDGTPARIHVVDAMASHDLENPCSGGFPMEQNLKYGAPMDAVVGVTDPDAVSVGDEVCFEGFVMDYFCIDRGTLLDAPDIVSLMNPELHSLHCLIDVPRCRETPYELLAPPAEGETMYSRAFRLTENSKQGFLSTASAVGNPFPPDKAPCTDCVGTEGSLNSGFRAEVYGIVVEPAMADGTPPLIHVVDAMATHEINNPCFKSFPTEQNFKYGAPVGAVGVADPAAVSVGDEICFEGFVMDYFCIDRGTLLDAPDIVSLMNPELHSLHCLIDVPRCRETPYELLAPPAEGETMFSRAFRLTESSKQGFLSTASAVGNPTPPDKAPCTDCVGTEGSLNSGFRAEVYGIVVAPAMDDGTPALVHVVDASASHELENPCISSFPEEQNPKYGLTYEPPQSDPAAVSVGDEICFEGFVMDHFCIERGTLLDAPDIVSLLNPELHSLHCLIDVPRCRETPYELLAPPAEGETMYTRAFRLTENSKQGFLMTASAVGNPSPPDKAPCTDCVGTEGSLNSGFRAEVYGIVVAPAMDDGTPALVHVVDAVASHDSTSPCLKAFPTEQNPKYGTPLVGTTDPDSVSVGDEICFEGFVMDNFCIERGTLLDAPDIVSLMNPELHSLHCLIDVERCRETPYELLAPPEDGETMYTRAFRLTENSKQGFLVTASAVGNPTPPDKAPCTDCVGTEGSLNSGFRAEVYGIVVAPAMDDGTPPLVHVVDAVASHELTSSCLGAFPDQNPKYGAPLDAVGIADPAAVSVGDEICFEGFVMDHFCIERGTLLDAPDIVSLLNPELHSLHCLIDVPRCRETPYELLAPPVEGETMFSRAFRLTENSKQGFLSTASAVGNPFPPDKAPCTDCVGTEGSLNSGFRAEVYGVVVAPAMDDGTPPLVHVVDAVASNELSNPCFKSFPTEQNPKYGMPVGAVGVADPSAVSVGDEVCFEGFVMDYFCIERGTLLDAPDIVSLLNPELHSLHCLIDVPRCRETPYELLAPPADGESMYSRAFRLTENSKQGFLSAASAVGNPTPPDKAPCTDCIGTEGSLNSGFRAEVYGVVVAPAMEDGTPAAVHVVDAVASNELGSPCSKPFPPQQNPKYGAPYVGVADPTSVRIGDEICFEGFVMDHFCIERGTLLDAPDIVSLLNPELHSLHCLIDVPRCRETPYELLAPPAEGETMYSRAFRLTENSKQGFLSTASAVGNPSPPDKAPCTDCVGTEGSLNSGFRAEVYGIVLAPPMEDGTPALVHVVDAVASHELTNPCTQTFPMEQNPTFGAPLEPSVGVADPSSVSVGDEICFEGFVMDHFCIERGTLLDAPDIVSLLNPELHSLHCLIDVPRCRETPYELLSPPAEGETMYSRAFRLTENSKEGFLAAASAVGNPTPPDKAPCTDCVGTEGSLNSGFRAEVYGIVVAPAMDDGTPALVHVVDAVASNELSNPCLKSFPTEQNSLFGLPFEEVKSEDDDNSSGRVVELIAMIVAFVAIGGVLLVGFSDLNKKNAGPKTAVAQKAKYAVEHPRKDAAPVAKFDGLDYESEEYDDMHA